MAVCISQAYISEMNYCNTSVAFISEMNYCSISQAYISEMNYCKWFAGDCCAISIPRHAVRAGSRVRRPPGGLQVGVQQVLGCVNTCAV